MIFQLLLDSRGAEPTLIVCVKDTATFPRLTLVSRFPRVCTAASGRTAITCSNRQNSFGEGVGVGLPSMATESAGELLTVSCVSFGLS